jgi:hypothetical protein
VLVNGTRLTAIALLCLVAPAPVRAQGAELDPDSRELAAYRLTAATMQKVAAAHTQLAAALKSDPRFARLAQLKDEKKRLEAKEDPTEADAARLEALDGEIETAEAGLPKPLDGVKTLRDMEANVAKEPLLSAALRSAGLAPREYSTFVVALVQASLVHALQSSGTAKELPPELKGRVNPDNVAFVAAHQAEIESLFTRLRAAAGEEP